MKTFLTSYLQIFLAKGFVIGIFIASFVISFLWCYNVSKISVSTRKSKIIYSLGAGLGAVSGYFFTTLIL